MVCNIVNASGTLILQRVLVSVNIRKRSDIGRRVVPLRSTGEKADTNAYVGRIMVLNFEARLTDAEKITLQTIWEYTAGTTGVTLNDWSFTGWFRQKNILYEHIINPDRPWRAVMTFEITEWVYGDPLKLEDWGLDDSYFKVEGEVWFNEEQGGYIGYPVYFPTITGQQGGGYFESQAGV